MVYIDEVAKAFYQKSSKSPSSTSKDDYGNNVIKMENHSRKKMEVDIVTN